MSKPTKGPTEMYDGPPPKNSLRGILYGIGQWIKQIFKGQPPEEF